jgi:hypothetical protein
MENRKAAAPSQFAQSSRVLPPIFYFLFSIFAVTVLLAGCAAPGEPVERKAPTPTAINDLAATQQGDDVTLTFTLPKDSVEGRELKQPLAIEIFRDFQPIPPSSTPAAASAVPKAPTLLVTIPSAMVDQYDTRGRIRYSDELKPEDFTQHPGAQAVYIVRTRTSPKKISANSNAVPLRVEPAADQIADVKAEITHQGVVLTWTPPRKTAVGSAPPIALYRIFRHEVNQTAASGPAPQSQKLSVQIGDCPAPPFRDTQAEFGKTYIYTVRSVAQYADLQVESLDSPPIAVSPLDTFPPAAPEGLVVVLVPAQASAPAYLDLSWSISAENDIAGYNIYRTEQEGAPGQKQNPELLRTPAFRDMNTMPGHRYFYTVTAVDRVGNESPASAAAPGEVPVESPTGAAAEVPVEVPTEGTQKAQPKS